MTSHAGAARLRYSFATYEPLLCHPAGPHGGHRLGRARSEGGLDAYPALDSWARRAGFVALQNAILWAMKIISTAEAARRLGVTPNRVRALIEAKRLKAFKYGREWLIYVKDLDAVKDRKVGRPRKSRKSAKR
jgi:excisionase family DNA binding protein